MDAGNLYPEPFKNFIPHPIYLIQFNENKVHQIQVYSLPWWLYEPQPVIRAAFEAETHSYNCNKYPGVIVPAPVLFVKKINPKAKVKKSGILL